MSKLKVLTDYQKRGKFDEIYTPKEAIYDILPFIPKNKIIWECTAIEESNIVNVLRNNNYEVIGSHLNDDKDFMVYEPEHYDICITNPPYGLKNDFLKRGFELNKPFMFLLPLTTLEGKIRGELFKEYGIQIIIPNKRYNFKPKKGSSAWFQTSWFCYGMNLKNDINFL